MSPNNSFFWHMHSFRDEREEREEKTRKMREISTARDVGCCILYMVEGGIYRMEQKQKYDF